MPMVPAGHGSQPVMAGGRFMCAATTGTTKRRALADLAPQSIPIIAVAFLCAQRRRKEGAQPAAMITFQGHSVPANCARKLNSAHPKPCIDCCSAYVRFWHKADIPRLSPNVCYWG
jgi:hypothetical protein